VDGRTRTFSVAPAGNAPAPLLIVLHGAGGAGPGMAALTGLAERGPARGFACVFPDGWGGVWSDGRTAPQLKRRQGIDDVAFLNALVARLVADGVAEPGRVFGAGISNGAFMTEHLARHALMPLAGIALVAGTAPVTSRQAAPAPLRPTIVTAFGGTADPLVPYAGGPIGPLGRVANRRSARQHAAPGRGLVAPTEDAIADWVTTNGLPPDPTIDAVPTTSNDVSVTRLSWRAIGRPSVTLHRIVGGGHTWPGGAQYLPQRIVGRVADLDATGIILDEFSRA